jgi:hypothetical protein
MSTEQRHTADELQKPNKLGVRRKTDLASDKKTFNEKFTDFIRAHPSEAEGLAAYDALPD